MHRVRTASVVLPREGRQSFVQRRQQCRCNGDRREKKRGKTRGGKERHGRARYLRNAPHRFVRLVAATAVHSPGFPRRAKRNAGPSGQRFARRRSAPPFSRLRLRAGNATRILPRVTTSALRKTGSIAPRERAEQSRVEGRERRVENAKPISDRCTRLSL